MPPNTPPAPHPTLIASWLAHLRQWFDAIPTPDFLWPQFLWLLLLLPVLVVLYVWMMNRRRKLAVQYASLSLVREAMGRGPGWRRHLPPFLMLLALAAMLLATARPVAVIALPMDDQTIMLAIDVSASMRATDVLPNRMIAAQQAAKAFIAELPRRVRVGIVAFAGSAQVAQLPTQSREDLEKAIDGFQLQRGTATGNGIVMALATLFPNTGIEMSAMGADKPSLRGAMSMDDSRQPPPDAPPPVAPGSYGSAAVVMLTDGQRTTGVDPMDAAQIAADRGVRVYTVGVGTRDGDTIGFEGWSMRVKLDEETLKAIAAKTQAEYFYAGSATDLKKIYNTLSSRLTVEKHETEISSLFALVAAAFALVATMLSLWWFNRIG